MKDPPASCPSVNCSLDEAGQVLAVSPPTLQGAEVWKLYIHMQLCGQECETTVSSFPFRGLTDSHALGEFRKSHPKIQH